MEIIGCCSRSVRLRCLPLSLSMFSSRLFSRSAGDELEIRAAAFCRGSRPFRSAFAPASVLVSRRRSELLCHLDDELSEPLVVDVFVLLDLPDHEYPKCRHV